MEHSRQIEQSSTEQDARQNLPEVPLAKEVHKNQNSPSIPMSLSKVGNLADQSYLDVPLQSMLNGSIENLGQYSDADADSGSIARARSRSPLPPPESRTWRSRAKTSWKRNKGVVLMVLAQFFGSAMAAVARLMETDITDRAPMNPFQIRKWNSIEYLNETAQAILIFARQSVTVLFSLLYMWFAKVPDAPLGPRKLRPLLALRGFGGFFGVIGLYFSLIYLPIADAVVMTFVAPMLAAWICSLLMKTPFTRTQQIAGLISFVGVILIARPFSLFSALSTEGISPTASNTTATQPPSTTSNSSTSPPSLEPSKPTPTQRAIAVLFGLLGVFGAACAYVTISSVGKRAHPLISVNYFATWCTLVSFIALAFVPSIPFRMPATTREWTLLIYLGVSGFVMQFLLTAALSHERSNRVLNMVYVQMLFALGFDKIVWGDTPGVASLLGGALILGSVIWAAVKTDKGGEGKNLEEDRPRDGNEEEAGLVAGMEDASGGSEPSGALPDEGGQRREDDVENSPAAVELQILRP